MLIDVNTYIGHWPFRQLRHNTATALAKRLDQRGIDRAMVASLNGVFYRNVHSANEEIAKETRRLRDRLIPFATLNPTFPGWEEDLRRCAEDLELQGLRLYPQYHNYQLTDSAALELIDAATQLGWAVQLPIRIEDRRTRHPFDLAADLSSAALTQIVKLRPKTKWMFLDALGLDGSQFPAKAHFLVEISRMSAVLQNNIPDFIEQAGPEHLAFGTGMPLKVPESALLKLDVLKASKRVKEGIAWRNAAAMLGLKP